MKNRNKMLALLLAGTMVAGTVTGCGETKPETPAKEDKPAQTQAAEQTTAAQETQEVVDLSSMTYDEQSDYLYKQNLGEFLSVYEDAKASQNVAERYAKMATAEAKLLSSGVMIPTTGRGGNYAISRVVPGTGIPTLWGNDQDRFHNLLIVTEPIVPADRTELRAKYGELKGTGTFVDWAKEFLAEKGYELKDTYNYGSYTSDPKTWDILATSRAADSEAIVNTFDGLLEYDNEGIQQSALATSYDVSADGLTYTFHLREGVEWVDSQGRKVADVCADDFVAGMQHMLDAAGGLESLIFGIVKNAEEYVSGDVVDFAEVGVKAVDDLTLEYTLCEPCSYFVTMFGYNVFAPMSRTYFESQGGKFGADFDSSAASYTYATSPDNIAYCGPYLVTNFTSQNTIVFKANPTYWNKDNITIKTITWLFNDGSDATKSYNDMKAGILDGAGLNSSALELAKADGWFDQYAYVSGLDGTSYMAFLNINRNQFANINDEKTVVSPQSEEEQERTRTALGNVHFRRAVSFAFDRKAQNAQKVGDDLALTSVRNSYTPATFVSLPEDVTIDINGTATTFKAGTWYGEIVQAQLDADGIPMKVFDPNGDDGIGSGDGFDGWFNPANAVAELDKAVEELAAIGVTVDAANPIQLDLPFPSNSETYTNSENAVKQSIESALGGKVVVNLVECADYNEWYYAGYYTDYGYEANFNIYDLSGWGPDYGDPSTYLDTFLPDYSGYMIKNLGIY